MTEFSSGKGHDRPDECLRFLRLLVAHILPKDVYAEDAVEEVARIYLALLYGACLSDILTQLKATCVKEERSQLKLIEVARWLADHLAPEGTVFSPPAYSPPEGAPRASAILAEYLWYALVDKPNAHKNTPHENLLKDARNLERCLNSIDGSSKEEVEQRLKLGSMFEPLPLYIVNAACEIARGQFAEDDIQSRDMRPHWIDKNGRFHLERVFEDVVFDLFANWVSVHERAESWSGKSGLYPDGVLTGAGVDTSSVLYDAKQSKNPCDLRVHEAQIRDHLNEWGKLLNVGHYLLVAEKFTLKSRERATNLNLIRPDERQVCVSLWEIEALLYLGQLCHPTVSGTPKVLPGGKREIFRALVSELIVNREIVDAALLGALARS